MSLRAEHNRGYDVIVVGAGHAGCEAALAAARMGRRTLLLTMNLDSLAYMPCNPSIGGPAKGHLVREIDALGGEMARNIDRTFIQIRMLNTSKGPAVQAPRAQADRRLYSLAMGHVLESTPNLDLKQGLVEEILTRSDRVAGVRVATGQRFTARAVVLTTGTFLGGTLRSGSYSAAAGRAGETAATELGESLKRLGFTLGRLQTNTPPRVDARTIDFDLTTPQFGSSEPLYFSFEGAPQDVLTLPTNPVYPMEVKTPWRRQLPCYLVHTNEDTHRVIQENLQWSPVGVGQSDVSGPRYCPSIEEKIVRFAHKASHSLFLEPEGYATTEVYVQGGFTGLPMDVQQEFLRTIPALARVEIMRPGYTIAYDYVPSYQLKSTLETRRIHGLFHAGQINGTSGYEEAASQGLLAGINAARWVRDEDPVVIGRDEGYLGVMVDDLVTREITEPYRLFTSRAEYRLLLRQDNADLRLTPKGFALGLIPEGRHRATEEKRVAIDAEIERLMGVMVRPDARSRAIFMEEGLAPLDEAVSAYQLLRRPSTTYNLVARLAPPQQALAADVMEQVEINAHYEGYIAKQQQQVARAYSLENRRIPERVDYRGMIGLRSEAKERLESHRPLTVGQAARIEGVNPADISVLLVNLERADEKA